jgi:hypothetical protein
VDSERGGGTAARLNRERQSGEGREGLGAVTSPVLH